MSLEDKLYKYLHFYKNLPTWLKILVGKAYSYLPNRLKYGAFYFDYRDRIANWRPENQDKLIQDQLTFALSNIPFYIGKEYPTSLSSFPILSKNDIKKNQDLFVSEEKQHFLKANTGGSSGTPFEFYLEKGVSRPKEQAHFDWYWKQFGYNAGDRVLMIRGESLSDNKLYEYQPIGNKLVISCYLINTSNINHVVEAINNFSPKFIHAYPSAVKSLTNYITAAGARLNINVKALFLGSECLFHEDRAFLETYYNAKVVNWYGHSERLVHAGNCPHSNEYHVYPFYGFLELLDENDSPVTEPGKKGRIIATGFDNKAMPFIRYDTGDEAVLSHVTKCKCGFKGITLKEILGRGQDYIFLEDGSKVSLTAFIFGQHFSQFSLINELQLEQRKKGELLVRIVPNADISPEQIQNLQNKMETSVGWGLRVAIVLVPKIEKTSRGKHRFLIQNIE